MLDPDIPRKLQTDILCCHYQVANFTDTLVFSLISICILGSFLAVSNKCIQKYILSCQSQFIIVKVECWYFILWQAGMQFHQDLEYIFKCGLDVNIQIQLLRDLSWLQISLKKMFITLKKSLLLKVLHMSPYFPH